MKDSALQILEKLISFRSINGDYDANHEAIEYVDRFLSERGMHVMRYEFEGVESLVATTKRAKTPTVMLCGHLDVVPGADELFAMKRQDGKLIGRGMVDMKAAVAAYLQIVDDLQDNLDDYDFGLMIVTDEESDGTKGTLKLVEEEGYLPKMCIVPDGGRDWALESLANGLWLIDVEIDGKSAHGSRPWEGDSAVERMTHMLREVKEAFPANPGWNTSTCTVSRFVAGEAMNQVPAHAMASLDMRFASIEDAKNIMTALKLVFEAHGAKITREVESAACVHDLDNPYLKSFAESMEKAVGYPTGTTISNAGSDARHFTPKGVPCAVFYPVGGGHHGPEEWISEEAYQQMQVMFRDYLEKEAKVRSDSTHDNKSATELEIAHA